MCVNPGDQDLVHDRQLHCAFKLVDRLQTAGTASGNFDSGGTHLKQASLTCCILVTISMGSGNLKAQNHQAFWPNDAKSTIVTAAANTPDQSYGIRRAITEADRASIQHYRSGLLKPEYSSTFKDAGEIQRDWSAYTDDNPALRSCRRPTNAAASDAGLVLKTQIATDCHARWSTGQIVSKARYNYGFFEASMKIADIPGVDNAFWLTTDHHFEIDVSEVFYPNRFYPAVQQWPVDKVNKHTTVASEVKVQEDLSKNFHNYAMLWTPGDMIFAIDGEPVAALRTSDSVSGPAQIRLSTALGDFAGKLPEHPQGHDAVIRALRVFAIDQ